MSFRIDLTFKILPKGAFSDKLEDTICYFNLVAAIKNYCQGKHFNLLEHLTESIYNALTQILIPYNNIIDSIKIASHKISPPIEDLHGGVIFSYLISSNGETR